MSEEKSPIAESKVRAIIDIQSLLSFMSDELDWALPQKPTLDEVTFDLTGTELNLSGDVSRRLQDGVIRQLRPSEKGNPGGFSSWILLARVPP